MTPKGVWGWGIQIGYIFLFYKTSINNTMNKNKKFAQAQTHENECSFFAFKFFLVFVRYIFINEFLCKQSINIILNKVIKNEHLLHNIIKFNVDNLLQNSLSTKLHNRAAAARPEPFRRRRDVHLPIDNQPCAQINAADILGTHTFLPAALANRSIIASASRSISYLLKVIFSSSILQKSQ